MSKKVFLIGGKSKAKSLALSLIGRGYCVTAVNDTYRACLELAQINKLTVIHGDGTRPFILEDANAKSADIAIALTAKDEDNLVICELCKKRFHVPKTVALVSDPKKTDMFYKMGIDRVVCAISAVTNIIEHQTFVEKIATIIPVGEGRIQIAEVPVTEAAPVAGKKLWEIDLPKEVIVSCILRGDTTMILRGDTRILAGDMLVVISGNGQEVAAVQALTGGAGNGQGTV